MKKTFELNHCADFQSSLFFWIKQYLRHKMITLSTRLVYDRKLYIVTTDGSFTELSREQYIEGEEKTVAECKAAGKPTIMILNTRVP